MKELKDTIELMNSSDYKEGFKAEYFQTKIRYEKLRKMIIKHEAEKLHFKLNSTPLCYIELLKEQAANMWKYLYALEVRAEIENIDLEE